MYIFISVSFDILTRELKVSIIIQIMGKHLFTYLDFFYVISIISIGISHANLKRIDK